MATSTCSSVWFRRYIGAFLLAALHSVVGDGISQYRRIEYKYSLKGPYLAQRDGTIPFWEHGGSAIASEEQVRITPSLRSKKGFMWTKNKVDFPGWEVEIFYRVSGRGRVGADGLAFWFTTDAGVEGPVFGSNDKWNGLGLFFDSFDNDNKHNNPVILAVVNDGSMSYDHQNDGINQQLAGCLRDYRNKPFITRVKVEYFKNTLTVMVHNGLSNNDQEYEMCFRAENVRLPSSGYFGISAATGGLADDHDIVKFITHSLSEEPLIPHDRKQEPPPAQQAQDQQKLTQEYEQYRDQLEKQKEEYKKEHKDQGDDEESWFDAEGQRELLQIFEGQSKIHMTVTELNQKLDGIRGQQERVLSVIAALQQQQLQLPQGGGGVPGQQPPIVPVDSIRRQEVETLFNNQREIAAAVRDVKAYVNEIHVRTQSQPGGSAGGGSAGYDTLNSINELKDRLGTFQQELTRTVNSKPECNCGSGPIPGCVSTLVFILVVSVQLIVLIGYMIYKDNKQSQAKKFY